MVLQLLFYSGPADMDDVGDWEVVVLYCVSFVVVIPVALVDMTFLSRKLCK